MTDTITTTDKRKCAERELGYRKRVYERFVNDGRMSAGKAAHELACMEAILADYQTQEAKERML